MSNKYLLTDMSKEYSKGNLNEIFGHGKSPKNIMFILSCQSCPSGYYPSWVSFTSGINTQIVNFIRITGGMTTIEFDNMVFYIDVRSVNDSVGVDRKFNSFAEALGFCMIEDERFWNEKTLGDDLHMSNKH